MKMKQIIFAAVMLTLPAFADIPVRIDIAGRNAGIRLPKYSVSENLKAGYAQYLKKHASTTLICYSAARTNPEWKKYSVSFTPDKSGAVRVELKTTSTSVKVTNRVLIDNLEIKGADMFNPSFEEGENGKADAWEGKGRIVPGGKDGKRCASVTYREILYQYIRVFAGIPVTITFIAREDTPVK